MSHDPEYFVTDYCWSCFIFFHLFMPSIVKYPEFCKIGLGTHKNRAIPFLLGNMTNVFPDLCYSITTTTKIRSMLFTIAYKALQTCKYLPFYLLPYFLTLGYTGFLFLEQPASAFGI